MFKKSCLAVVVSVTWFKLTEGDYMLLDDGAELRRDDEPPVTGSWWQGAIGE